MDCSMPMNYLHLVHTNVAPKLCTQIKVSLSSTSHVGIKILVTTSIDHTKNLHRFLNYNMLRYSSTNIHIKILSLYDHLLSLIDIGHEKFIGRLKSPPHIVITIITKNINFPIEITPLWLPASLTIVSHINLSNPLYVSIYTLQPLTYGADGW